MDSTPNVFLSFNLHHFYLIAFINFSFINCSHIQSICSINLSRIKFLAWFNQSSWVRHSTLTLYYLSRLVHLLVYLARIKRDRIIFFHLHNLMHQVFCTTLHFFEIPRLQITSLVSRPYPLVQIRFSI